ncbi:MAG: hydrogenase nickel incorporation protein HypB [Chloroflexota bacterium]
MNRQVTVVENILSANDQIAERNRATLDSNRVFSVNLMASPGAGKTSVITSTVAALQQDTRIAGIDGDLATSIDADRMAAMGIPAVQINTGGSCHLDALMLNKALEQLSLADVDLLLVENVGNLVCPSSFALGVHLNILIASVPEGDDKPYKYPGMYQGVDAVLLNKIDVLHAFDFDMEYFELGVQALNPGLMFMPISCTSNEGMDKWIGWLRQQAADYLISLGETGAIR